MNKYRKSLLSLAAIMAISTTVNAAYIPLTDSAGNEEKWSLFGVAGLKTTGLGAGTSAGTFSITDDSANSVTDATQDELFTTGFLAGTASLGKVKVFSPYSSVQVRIDTTGVVYNETEPVRTMYVTMTEGAGPSFAVSYKASLEGSVMQYSIATDGSDAHTIVINSANTYDNPGLGEVIQELAGVEGSSLSKITELADYDFTNNPSNSAYYDEGTADKDAPDTVAGEYLSLYSYDATLGAWDFFDSRNTEDANDFNDLEKGKAYWAKMNAAGNAAGIVLGSASIGAADYTANAIVAGWNLMSFQATNSDIRKSSTGLIVTLQSSAAGDEMTIYDASGNHSVNIAWGDQTSDETLVSKFINNAIAQAKIDGQLPDTFDLRAFPTATADSYVLISNKRFMIVDTSAVNTVIGVTTLTGAIPYAVADVTDLTQTDDTTAITNLGTTPATAIGAISKYGEYAMIVEPLVGTGSAAALAGAADDGAKVHIQSAAGDATLQAPYGIDGEAVAATALGNLVTALDGNDIDASSTYQVSAYELDTDYDTATENVLLASTEPFYVRDYTFTRVFKNSQDTTTTGVITVTTPTVTDAYTVPSTTATATIATNLTTANKVYAAAAADTDYLVVVATETDSSEFTVTENTSSTVAVDHLADATVADDLAKGAIKGVYSLDSFATRATTNTATVTMTAWPADDANTLDIEIVNTLGATDAVLPVNYFGITGVVFTGGIADTTEGGLAAAALKTHIEDALSAANITATVTLTNVPDTGVWPIFTVTSTDLKSIVVNFSATANTAIANDAGNIIASTPDLSDDLKFNAVYTPNYVKNGPLYTIQEAGFLIKAMVTGTTDLSDGTVNWDSVDLSRKPSEWLDSQDYNLFSVDSSAGYWVYLEEAAYSNPLSVTNPSFRPTYTHHFNENGTNYNSVSGNLELTVEGMSDYDNRDSAIVSAYVAGSNIEMSRSGTSNVYTGKLSSYELKEMSAGFEYEVFANVADGLGYNIINEDTTVKVDFKKPVTPTIDLGDGTSVTFASTSEDAAGYYVFNGQIPEEGTTTATNLLAKLTSEEATGYALCASTSILRPTAYDTPMYDLNVVAVDGTGVLAKGNVSDTVSKNYVAMLKDAILLTDTNSGASDASIYGEVFAADCTSSGAQTVNYGVTLTSETDLQTVKMSYEPQNVTDLTAVPITLFVNAVSEDPTVIAKLTYADIYVGSIVFIELQGIVYSLELPSVAQIATYTDGTDITDPLDLTDAGTSSAVQTDQAL